MSEILFLSFAWRILLRWKWGQKWWPSGQPSLPPVSRVLTAMSNHQSFALRFCGAPHCQDRIKPPLSYNIRVRIGVPICPGCVMGTPSDSLSQTSSRMLRQLSLKSEEPNAANHPQRMNPHLTRLAKLKVAELQNQPRSPAPLCRVNLLCYMATEPVPSVLARASEGYPRTALV